MMTDKLDALIARGLLRLAAWFARTPTTPPIPVSPLEAGTMLIRRWKVNISAEDLAKGAWTLSVMVDGRPTQVIPVTSTATVFRTPADLPFSYSFTLVAADGTAHLPSLPVTVAPVPRTPQLTIEFLDFEEVPDPPTATVIGPDQAGLPTV